MASPMAFIPSPTGLRFMADRSFVKLICGPIGGGKSSVALQELWRQAIQQEPFGEHRIRRTKFAILRNTSAMLKQTVKPLIDYWFVDRPTNFGLPAMGQWRVTDATFEIKARLGDGTILHTEFVMAHADTPDDVRRLLSAEYSSAWVEEAREIDPVVFEGLQGRTARFPNVESGGVTYPCTICSTNPPPIGTFWHGYMVKPPKNVAVFFQPPAILENGAINPDAENLKNLDPDYYPNLMTGKTEDWINVYLRNKFGAGGMGQPVFQATFKQSYHVAKTKLSPINSAIKRVIIGSDNGLNAGAVIGQEDAKGRINVLADAYVPKGETMGYDRFLDTIIIPKLRDLNIPHANVMFVMDPACWQRAQANEVTIAQIVAQRHFMVAKAPTNDPERRISAVEGLLMRNVMGEAGLLISPDCEHLVNALDWGYRNKKTLSPTGVAKPDKDHYSNIADGFQYFCLYFNAGASVDAFGSSGTARPVERSTYAYT